MTKVEFKKCWEAYFDAVRNFIYFKSGDKELATDIAQETFLKLWEKKFSYHEQRTKSLLYKIAHGLWVSHLRKINKNHEYVFSIKFEIDENCPIELLQYKELKVQIEHLLKDLPEKQRVIFLMSRNEGLSYKEIAIRMALSQKSIEKYMTKTLTIFKQKLRER